MWWVLTAIAGLAGVVCLVGIFKLDIFNQNLKEGQTPWGKKQASGSFVFCLILTLAFAALAIHGGSAKTAGTKQVAATESKAASAEQTTSTKQKANTTADPDQQLKKDLCDVVITNVLDLKKPKLDNKHTTFKHDENDGSYTVQGIVSGTDQSGSKVEYDFNAFVKPDGGDNIVQWSTENTSTYKTETGTANLSNGEIKKLQ